MPAAPPPPVVVAPPAVAAPLGRPASLDLELLTEDTFYGELLSDLNTASSVVMATYLYDDPDVHRKLLARLEGRRAFELVMLIDRQACSSGVCRRMRPRLRDLIRAGADVYLCDGHSHGDLYGSRYASRRGHMHIKGVIVDRRVAYCGSMNITRSARTNREVMFKITGPPVRDLLAVFHGLITAAEEM